MAAIAQALDQCRAVDTLDRCLTRGVHFRQQQGIHAAQHFHKVFKQVTGAAVAVRLESQHQAFFRESTTHCGQRCGHFHRVVAVVVDQGVAAAILGRQLAVTLETAAYAGKLGQAFLDSVDLGTTLQADHRRGQGVQYVWRPGIFRVTGKRRPSAFTTTSKCIWPASATRLAAYTSALSSRP